MVLVDLSRMLKNKEKQKNGRIIKEIVFIQHENLKNPNANQTDMGTHNNYDYSAFEISEFHSVYKGFQ